MQVLAERRDDAGISMRNPPTFNEIRSLGGALLIERGWTKKQVQALMTHSESITEHYLEGHGYPADKVKGTEPENSS